MLLFNYFFLRKKIPIQHTCLVSVPTPMSLSTPSSKINYLNEVQSKGNNSKQNPINTIQRQKTSSVGKRQEQYCVEEVSQESQLQFSKEIMIPNPRNQTRKQKESTKITWLALFDWMSSKTLSLRLSKEVFYLGMLILKLFLGAKKSNDLSFQNSRKYALTCLLLSSKMHSIGGNFLLSQEKNDRQTNNESKSLKEELFNYQIKVLQSLNFKLPTKTFITETMVKIMLAWNRIAKQYNLSWLTFQFCNKKKGSSGFSLLQNYLYLVDFILVRKIVLIPTKDLPSLQTSFFFQQNLTSILYHLTEILLQYRCKQRLQTLRKAQKALAIQINPCLKQDDLSYKSKLLRKRIRKLLQKNKLSSKREETKIAEAINRQIINTPQYFQKQCNNQSAQKVKSEIKSKESPNQSIGKRILFDEDHRMKKKLSQGIALQKQNYEFGILFTIDMQNYGSLLRHPPSDRLNQVKQIEEKGP